MAKNVYEIITERFMEQLHNGIIPWEKPWVSINGARVGGWSHTTGTPYSLINQMMLPSQGEYITYKQINQEGGKLKKGSKGYPICFWKSYQTTQRDNETNLDEEITVPVLRYYIVFRVEDCEGISYNYSKEEDDALKNRKAPQKIKSAETLAKAYLKSSGVQFEQVEGDSAYYTPAYDKVVLPLKKQFDTAPDYYSTLFHEFTHSTGHRDRLNRLGNMQSTRGKDYSLEELVAEIGSCAILYNLGIETHDTVKNSNAYLQSWLAALSNDSRMIVKAASRAQKAVRYIFGEFDAPACNDVKKVDYSDPAPSEVDKQLYPEGCPF